MCVCVCACLLKRTRICTVLKSKRNSHESEVEEEHGYSKRFVHLPSETRYAQHDKAQHSEQQHHRAGHTFTSHLHRDTIDDSEQKPRYRQPAYDHKTPLINDHLQRIAYDRNVQRKSTENYVWQKLIKFSLDTSDVSITRIYYICTIMREIVLRFVLLCYFTRRRYQIYWIRQMKILPYRRVLFGRR